MPVTFHPAKHNATPFPSKPEWKEALATRLLRDSCRDQFQKCGEIFQSSLDSKPSSAVDSDIIPSLKPSPAVDIDTTPSLKPSSAAHSGTIPSKSNNKFVGTVVKAYRKIFKSSLDSKPSSAAHINIIPSSKPSPAVDSDIIPSSKPSSATDSDTIPSSKPSSAADSNIIPSNNGFVNTVVKAYSDHRALIIRPDDVWLCILTQFSFFVNGNAEQLRKQFVAHEGKKELEITATGTRYTVDFGDLARQMTELIEQNVVDPDLREWIMPAYTTTTLLDTTVSAIVMMATMKEYFNYSMSLCCGIPRVTLEGTKEDWENILSRIGKLKQYGPETTAWYELLRPVISRFVNAFDKPDAQKNLDFWQKVAHHEGGGSGPTWLAGWINAFCVFDSKGKWTGYPIGGTPNPPRGRGPSAQHYLTLDGTIYHRTDTNRVPPSVVEVDVKLNDNGTELNTLMTAGLVGTRVCDSGDKALSPNGTMDTARPVLAWWIALKNGD